MKSQQTSRAVLFIVIVSGSFAATQTKSATPTQASSTASGSPSAKIGLFVNPQKDQTPEQQTQDESACYATAQKQTEIDPAAPPPPPPQAPQQKGGAVKGAAKGAAGGAAIGAIADDEAGTGAAAGATAGAVRGRRQQKKANKQAEQQAQQQGQAQQQQRMDTFRRAFSSCIDSKGYSVK